MATTSPARIDDDLYASAKLAGEVQSRSASQQVVHWARIGREIEASATISQKDIAEVLAGSRSYDSLSAKEQALVRAEWSTRMDVAREALNLAQQFGAEGRTWVELDEDGAVVERSAASKPAKKPSTASRRRAGGGSVG
jgi:PAB1-binding protein PBP1